ncbi:MULTISPECIES: DUF4189 domain-containing protein [Lysobacter]|uniref:DUF4189 domain-containing protein n=1 Tax=Lysobacter TaxID=68 RepID=UPI001F2657AC|nr:MULTISPECIES: DUF4189 domain-containing protein [Lysobacter]UJB17447.1 DUF4189 domain-containing protein [Lysobacter capsici]UJQ28830.1 DUF4189 domain-containing protein [Lysobacter gummosus]
MKICGLLLALLFPVCGPAMAQCPAGIPVAGNPACIPPDRSNSPYYQSGADTAVEAAQWEDRWGAIAVDEAKKSVGIGTSEMMSSERKAKASALRECRGKGGTQCSIALIYRNQCGVLIWRRSGYNTIRAGTIERVAQLGLERCAKQELDDCQVFHYGCSYPEKVR